VFIDDGASKHARADCQASADVDLDVPKGATVQIQTRDGDICITGVDAAYAGSQNGDISFERVAQRIEAGSIGGTISVKDSSGHVSLSTAGGGIDAANVKALSNDDSFEVISVSGDIQLNQVSHAKLTARSVTGNINLSGPLAHRGDYGFTTTSGDVTLTLPSDASFKLLAKLAQDGEIITDFPLTITTEPAAPPSKPSKNAPPAPAAPRSETPKPTPVPAPAPKPETDDPSGVAIVKVTPPIVKVGPIVVASPFPVRRLIGVCGTGDATLAVNSFSGSLRLQKN
jgi:predicted DNA-binding protein with PD1-like motif